jgi:hypothetical protein
MAKLTRLVLHFDDGTTHEVDGNHTAVYKNVGRAKKAGEKEPWKEPPTPRGKDDGDDNGLDGGQCYMWNGVVICP